MWDEDAWSMEELPYEESSTTISDEELTMCVGVLDKLACDMAQFDTPRFRPLRRALRPAYEALRSRHFVGAENGLEYGLKRQLRKEADGRRARQVELDRRHRDTTQLRKGRISSLKQLCEDGGGRESGRPLAIEAQGHGPGDEISQGAGGYFLQVPDGAVRDDASSAATAAATNTTTSDLATEVGTMDLASVANPDGPALYTSRQCYTCKARFTELHHFYAQLCPACSSLNFRMRHASEDLTGRVALLTGSRVKIGFEIGLKLLRAGATLLATTRFPADAAKRYAAQPDFCCWEKRLQLFAVDLRDVVALERFCTFLSSTLPRLDFVVNNACQTVRRPSSYYSHLIREEAGMQAVVTQAAEAGMLQLETTLPETVPPKKAAETSLTKLKAGGSGTDGDECAVVGMADTDTAVAAAATSRGASLVPLFAQQAAYIQWETQSAHHWQKEPNTRVASSGDSTNGAPSLSPAQLSQVTLTMEDQQLATTEGSALLPTGRLDVNGQQIDLRSSNSWLMKLHEVSAPELVEVFTINTLAPFLINARLQPLLAATAAMPVASRAASSPPSSPSSPSSQEASPRESSRGQTKGATFIINVSAMEGKFYRHKTPNHPHTNMAKAALNMMTRTSAEDLAKRFRIFMTAVDTGWINDENPREKVRPQCFPSIRTPGPHRTLILASTTANEPCENIHNPEGPQPMNAFSSLDLT